jgi:uncharacterized membrane protein (DUF4010 family)
MRWAFSLRRWVEQRSVWSVNGQGMPLELARGAQEYPGVFVSAGVFGLTDIDALVVSMAKDTAAQLPATTAAAAMAIGVLSNTLLKLAIGVVIGVKQFRRLVFVGLSAVALACGISLMWLR